MANYIRAFFVMIVGLSLGFAATALSIRSGHGLATVRVGPWTAWPRNGTTAIDPYARAILARSGEAPLGRDQGIAFHAGADSDGAPLDGRCEYRILDPTPPARFWTIGVSTPEGALIPNPAQRYAYASTDILRREGGAFEIVVAQEARPGNWLSAGSGPFIVTLRLYDTPLDVESALDPSTFPRIVKVGCA
jgi:hypothetical protein